MVAARTGRVRRGRPARGDRTGRPAGAGRSATAVVALLGVVYWTAHTMLRPLVGPYVLDGGGTAAQASLALASFAVLPTLLALPIGALTDRWGVRSLLVGGGLTMAVGGAVLLLPLGLPGVIASQAVVGVGTLAVWVSLQTVATLPRGDDEPPRARNARLATFSLFLAAGQAVGPALGTGLADTLGAGVAFGGFCVLSLAVVGLACAVRVPRPARVLGGGAGVLRSYRDGVGLMRTPAVLVTLVVSFTALVVLDVRTAYHPLVLGEAGVPQWQVGVLLSVAAAAGFASRPLFPVAMARLPEPLMVGLVLAVSSASVVAVAVVPPDPWLLGALAAVNGFALGFAQPLTLVLMADHTPADRRGLASGLRSSANRGAQFVNPAAFGVLSGVMPLTGAFLVVGGVLAVVTAGSTVALARARRAAGPATPPAGTPATTPTGVGAVPTAATVHGTVGAGR